MKEFITAELIAGRKTNSQRRITSLIALRRKRGLHQGRKRANYIRGLIEGINLRGTIVSARKEEVGEKSRIN